MPRVLAANAISQMKRGSGVKPVALLDVQVLSGTTYYWSEVSGVFPYAIGAPASGAYQPWIKSWGPMRLSRSLKTDAGEIVLQNISGSPFTRDVLKSMDTNEFEGALAIFRLWKQEAQAEIFTFYGQFSDQAPDSNEVRFRLLQLADPNVVDGQDLFSEKCTWRYKSRQCGSTSSNLSCAKTFKVCTAVERFNGVLNPPQVDALAPPLQPKIRRPRHGQQVGGVWVSWD